MACCTFGESGMNTLIGSATADHIATADSSSASADSGSADSGSTSASAAASSSPKNEFRSKPSSVQIL